MSNSSPSQSSSGKLTSTAESEGANNRGSDGSHSLLTSLNSRPLLVEPPILKNRKRSRKEGPLAKCDKCKTWGTNLRMCFNCDHVFGPDVQIAEDTFRPRLPKTQSSTVKQEIYNQTVISSTDSMESAKNSKDPANAKVHLAKERSVTIQRSSNVLNHERRIRVIQKKQNSSTGISHVSNTSKVNKKVFHAQMDSEDTIIEETRINDVPHTVRILQYTSFGALQILKDNVYRANLNKIIFGCPSSIDFITSMLNNTLQLKAVRFGAYAFNLINQDNTPPTIAAKSVTLKDLKTLQMSFDGSKYDQYDAKGQELMRLKISTVLEIASRAFPNLADCDITVPERVELVLDSFLESNIEIKRRGYKQHIYKDKMIRFKVKPESEASPTVAVGGLKESSSSKEPSYSRTNAKSLKTENIVIIELSDEEDDDKSSVRVSSSKISSTK